MSMVQRIFLILLSAAIIVVLFYPLIKKSYQEYASEIINNELYRVYQDSILTFPFDSYKCTGVVQFRLNKEKRNIAYNCMVTADSGYSLDGYSGMITIELVDKYAFLIDQIVLNRKASISDENDNITSYMYRGDFEMPVKEFIKVKNVSVFNSLTFLKRFDHEDSRVASRPGKNKKTLLKPVTNSSFDEEMARWNKKAQRIRVGMTYSEMIANAGEPRLTARLSSQERLTSDYEEVKYNYGQKWIYFRSKLVAMIK